MMAQREKKRNGAAGDALPAPLVPPEVNLRGFHGFVLNVDRLLASELVALGRPEECWAALMLWCRAWQQTPPASLPNDDRVLASFSRTGTRWKRVRAVALRGFIECSDGRLYHRVLADEAMKAWRKRQQYQRDQERLKRWRAGQKATGEPEPQNADETRFNTHFESVSKPEETAIGTATGTATTKAIAEGDPAGRLAEWFIPLRRKLWPEALPIDGPTIAMEAREYLDEGLSEAACMDVIERGARRHAEKGGSPVTSLRFFKNSMQDAAARLRVANGGAATGGAAAPVAQTVGEDLEVWRRRVRSFRAKGLWIGQWGPKPGQPGCVVPAEVLQEGTVS